MTWTLEHVEGSLTQTAAAWGIRSVRRSLVSQAPDLLTFIAPTAYDGAALFAFDDTLKLYKDAATWFVGRVQSVRRAGDSQGEAHHYTVAGPWSYLDQICCQQVWSTTDGVSATPIQVRKTRLIIGQDAAGNKRTTAAEMQDAIDWAISSGAALQRGTVDAAVTIPYQEVSDITVAELIRLCLRWTPDALTWFDYSTSPPTLHIRRRADLAQNILAIDPSTASALDIRSRDELAVPAVVLRFEQASTVDGQVYNHTVDQPFPIAATGAELRALVATIDLAGASATYETQKLEYEDLDPTSKAFWKKHIPAIKDYDDADLTISNTGLVEVERDGSGNRTGNLVNSTKPRYIVAGNVSSWMGVSSEECIASAKITYSGSAGPAFTDLPVAVTVTGTTASRKTYRRLVSFQAAEPIPTGLAQALYDALSVVHYEGQFACDEAEVSGIARPGQKLCLTGGLAAWSAMDALVQRVEEDIDNGQTLIHFGPPQHLSPQDLVELLRATRSARPTWRLQERSTAIKAANGGQYESSDFTANHNASFAPGGEGGAAYQVVVCENGNPVTKTFLVQSP